MTIEEFLSELKALGNGWTLYPRLAMESPTRVRRQSPFAHDRLIPHLECPVTAVANWRAAHFAFKTGSSWDAGHSVGLSFDDTARIVRAADESKGHTLGVDTELRRRLLAATGQGGD